MPSSLCASEEFGSRDKRMHIDQISIQESIEERESDASKWVVYRPARRDIDQAPLVWITLGSVALHASSTSAGSFVDSESHAGTSGYVAQGFDVGVR